MGIDRKTDLSVKQRSTGHSEKRGEVQTMAKRAEVPVIVAHAL